MQHHTPHTWWVHLTSGQKGQMAVGEKGKHKAIYFSWLGLEPFVRCLAHRVQLLVFFCSSVSVVLFDTPGISRCRSQHVSVKSSSLFHHSIYLCFICFPWWSIDELKNLHADRTTVCLKPWQKPRARLGIRKNGLSPPPSILILTVPRRYFCCGSLLLLVIAVRIYTLVQLLC